MYYHPHTGRAHTPRGFLDTYAGLLHHYSEQETQWELSHLAKGMQWSPESWEFDCVFVCVCEWGFVCVQLVNERPVFALKDNSSRLARSVGSLL